MAAAGHAMTTCRDGEDVVSGSAGDEGGGEWWGEDKSQQTSPHVIAQKNLKCAEPADHGAIGLMSPCPCRRLLRLLAWPVSPAVEITVFVAAYTFQISYCSFSCFA
ncbi:hypothetical protein B0H14DRAFT_3491559 [Mycena olivaceomarginata]|nr:hypothetical protein B0H14DRAFT_3491559 [Mycena olivaceomarginata]